MLIKLKPNLACAPRRVNIVAIAGALALPLMFASPALAGAPYGEDVSVTINGTDLKNPQGVTKVYETLVGKAETACHENGRLSLSDRRAEHKCIDNLVEDFVLDIAHPELTALHNGGKTIIK